ncbi:MAG TPA: hypothetical protein VGD31_11155 [Sphingobacteriaceae bacterium]
MNKILRILIFLIISLPATAQHTGITKPPVSLNSFQDSLLQLSKTFINNQSEPERYNANYAFIKTLVHALKTPRSFNFKFDSLKTISIQTSQDRRFRIFTWHVMNNDGSYRYYGTVQMNNPDGKLVMFPLVDYSAAFRNPADSVTTNDKWYGAQYYKIIPVTYNVKVPYYILLGWKGNTPKSTKKVIDVIYFKDNKAFFGMPVFDGDKENPNKKRIIFEYTRQVSMGLNYDPKANLIVFDHLAPPDPKLKGNFESYGPDMSYDGYKLTNGRWKLVEDIEMKNPPSESDNNFNDPKKLKGSSIRTN